MADVPIQAHGPWGEAYTTYRSPVAAKKFRKRWSRIKKWSLSGGISYVAFGIKLFPRQITRKWDFLNHLELCSHDLFSLKTHFAGEVPT